MTTPQSTAHQEPNMSDKVKELTELIGQYGVQVATTGELAPSKELADAIAMLSRQASLQTVQPVSRDDVLKEAAHVCAMVACERGELGYDQGKDAANHCANRVLALAAHPLQDGDKDAKRLEKLREAVVDAADEWSGYVEVDNAPRKCSEQVAHAFDAAIAAIEGKEKA